METAGTKKARKAFNKMHPGKSAPKAGHGHTKGKVGSGRSSNVTGHKAPNATKGKGTAMRPGGTRSGPGFVTGHKAKNTTHGKG